MSKALAVLLSNEGDFNGKVIFSQVTRNDTKITFQLAGFLPYSTHAIHVHEYGDLSRGCASLGAHYNPSGAKHGKHAGDLIYNFTTTSTGCFDYTYITNNSDLGVSKLFGRSIVIHSFPDDTGSFLYNELSTRALAAFCIERGYPITGGRQGMLRKIRHQMETTGNAGARISCGVIGRSS